ncbi:hypothetical protein Tco_0612212 [Tanacetum coccineum]
MLWLSFLCSNSGKNGNSWVPIPVTTPSETGTSTATKMTVPSTSEEKTCKKNDVKARSLLLMALSNEHQLTFDQYVDAQSMFAAIKAQFAGNEGSKKTHKALLKQQYENFSASSLESLDSIFNRLQKLVSRLEILGVVTSPKDLNVKFLRSLPSEWDTHVVVWMNKPDVWIVSIRILILWRWDCGGIYFGKGLAGQDTSPRSNRRVGLVRVGFGWGNREIVVNVGHGRWAVTGFGSWEGGVPLEWEKDKMKSGWQGLSLSFGSMGRQRYVVGSSCVVVG